MSTMLKKCQFQRKTLFIISLIVIKIRLNINNEFCSSKKLLNSRVLQRNRCKLGPIEVRCRFEKYLRNGKILRISVKNNTNWQSQRLIIGFWGWKFHFVKVVPFKMGFASLHMADLGEWEQAGKWAVFGGEFCLKSLIRLGKLWICEG